MHTAHLTFVGIKCQLVPTTVKFSSALDDRRHRRSWWRSLQFSNKLVEIVHVQLPLAHLDPEHLHNTTYSHCILDSISTGQHWSALVSTGQRWALVSGQHWSVVSTGYITPHYKYKDSYPKIWNLLQHLKFSRLVLFTCFQVSAQNPNIVFPSHISFSCYCTVTFYF